MPCNRRLCKKVTQTESEELLLLVWLAFDVCRVHLGLSRLYFSTTRADLVVKKSENQREQKKHDGKKFPKTTLKGKP